MNMMQCLLLLGLVKYYFILGTSITNIPSDNATNWCYIKKGIKMVISNETICAPGQGYMFFLSFKYIYNSVFSVLHTSEVDLLVLSNHNLSACFLQLFLLYVRVA